MTSTARLYGGSLYELAAGEGLADLLLEQTKEVREIFRENPDYVRLLAEPSIPKLPSSNSSSSPAMQSVRPLALAIPSPTIRIVPVSLC